MRVLAGAHDRTRTGDLVLTKDALCLLSYVGSEAGSIIPAGPGASKVRPLAGRPSGCQNRARETAEATMGDVLLWLLIALLIYLVFFASG